MIKYWWIGLGLFFAGIGIILMMESFALEQRGKWNYGWFLTSVSPFRCVEDVGGASMIWIDPIAIRPAEITAIVALPDIKTRAGTRLPVTRIVTENGQGFRVAKTAEEILEALNDCE